MVTTNFNKSIIIHLSLFIMIGNSVFAQKNGFNTENVEYYIQNKKIGLRDITTKKLVVPCKYDYIGSFSKQKLATFKRNGLYGYLNDKSVEVIAPKYQEAKSFSSDEALAPVKSNGKWGFINKAGISKIPCKYDDVGGFTGGLSRVKQNGKWGMINTSGTIVIPCKYDELNNFGKQDFATASQNGLYGTIDKSGKVLVPFKYESPLYFNEDGFAGCKRDGKYGIVHRNGDETAKCIHVESAYMSSGLMCVKQGEKYGFIDYNGNLIIPYNYKHSKSFEHGYVGLSDEHGSYILTPDTKTIARFSGDYSSIYPLDYYEDGTLFVLHQDTDNGFKHALVNTDGEFILSCEYEDIKIFYGCGLIAVKKTDKWGFADVHGNLKIPYRYEDTAFHFQNNYIACKKDGKWGVIDTSGLELIPFKYDLIDQNGIFARTKIGDRFGAIGPDAKVVFEPRYDEVGYPTTSLRYYPVKLNGQDGYADYYGNDTF